jgi:glyoxylase-like metal-dependent hydrolase (beta-lactamase superfamily II)
MSEATSKQTPKKAQETTMKNDTAQNQDSTEQSSNGISRRNALRLLGVSGLAGGLTMLGQNGLAQTGGTTSPIVPASIPGHYRLKIGELEVFVLFDGTLNFPTQAYGVNGPVERINTALAANFLPVGPTVMTAMNGLLIKSPKGIVLIDAGTGGKGGAADGGRILANLAAIGVKPEDVNAVIISHLHPDHIGGLFVGGAGSVASQIVFRRAEHLITRREHATLANPSAAAQNRPASVRPFFDIVLQSFRATLDGRALFVAPGDQIIPGVEIIDAPGHTPGHIAVRISSGGQQMIHLVDSVVHHVLGFNPELRILFDEDPATASATRAKLFDQIATDRTLVMGYHFPWPGLAHIRRTSSGGYEWVPTVWDWAAQNG